MNKTVLTELIEFIDGIIQACTAEQQDRTRIEELERVKEKAISLLQKEREDIENAYVDGRDEELTANRENREHRQSTQYFHDTFT